MTEIDIKTLHKMIAEIVKEEIDNHRHGCVAARDADFLERSITPSKIKISEYEDYKKRHDKEQNQIKAKEYSDLIQYVGLVLLFLIGCAAAIGIRYING